MGERENGREREGFGGKGRGGWASWAQRGRAGGAAGSAGAAHGAGERKREEREKEKEQERKSFFLLFEIRFFLDECTYIFKQSKECMVRHDASNNIKYFKVLLNTGIPSQTPL